MKIPFRTIRITIFLIFINLITTAYTQNKMKKDIDTIYKQDFKDFSLQLVRDDSGENQAEFRTLFINKKTNISTKIFISTYKKDLRWIFGKSIGEGAYYTYNIIKGFHLENKLLVFYSCWGVVTAVSFDLTTMTHKTYYIGFYPHTGAFANLVHSMVAKEFRNIFYFHIKAGQQYGGKANILGYFDPKTNEMYDYIPHDTLGIKVSDIDKSFETLREDKETSVFIKKLLTRLKLVPENTEIRYLFRFEYQNFTYFFYLKDNILVEILRFDIEKRQWFADGYRAIPSEDGEEEN